MRILIADRQPAARSALHLLLKEERGLEVVGEAGDREDLLARACAGQPDLVLLDWDLARGGAAQLLSDLSAVVAGVRIVVISGRSDVHRDALAAGADAFCWKGEPPTRLLALLHGMCRGADLCGPEPSDTLH